jgi:hypothetical protein
MMAYNNGFPIGYQPYYQQMYSAQAQQFSPPTIHAEILQVENETAAMNYPVAAGASQMMMAKDDSEIYIKTAYANGQSQLNVYVRRPQKPSEPILDLSTYITRDEFESRLKAILEGKNEEGGVE